MVPEEKERFEKAQRSDLDMDVSRWIVVSVSFRSHDPNEESWACGTDTDGFRRAFTIY